MKYISIIISFVLSMSCLAQPVLTSSNMHYKLGDEYIIMQNDYPNWVTNIDVGATGAGCTWDYSNLQVPFSSGNLSVLVDPKQTAFADSAVHADICIKSCMGDTGSYQFLQQSNSSIDLVGIGWFELANSSFSRYEPYKNVLPLPLNYGDTFTDENVLIMRHENGALHLDSSQVMSEADGYGTLITPAATYADVMRIKRTTSYASYINMDGMWIKTLNSTVTDYFWYKPGIPVALFTIADGYDEPGNFMVSYLSHWKSTSVIVNKAVDALLVYPNPFENHLKFELVGKLPCQISIYDINGNMVINKSLNKAEFMIGTKDYLPGIYILKIRCKDAVYMQQIIKQ